MSNETKNVVDVAVDGADKVYGTAVDRTVERMDQFAENVEKDKETAKKATEAVVETAGVFAEAVADHVSGLLNGEKLDLKKEKERAISTIDKMVEKADAYYEVITDRIMERVDQSEKNLEKDIETGKELVNELKENAKNLK